MGCLYLLALHQSFAAAAAAYDDDDDDDAVL